MKPPVPAQILQDIADAEREKMARLEAENRVLWAVVEPTMRFFESLKGTPFCDMAPNITAALEALDKFMEGES